MKTTKEYREKMKVARHLLEPPAGEEMGKLLDDIDTLESRIRTLEEALKRIVRFNPSYDYTFEHARVIAREALEAKGEGEK